MYFNTLMNLRSGIIKSFQSGHRTYLRKVVYKSMDILVKEGNVILEAKCPICSAKHIIKAKVVNDKFVFPIPPGKYKCDHCNKHYHLKHKVKEMLQNDDKIYFDVDGAYVVCEGKGVEDI